MLKNKKINLQYIIWSFAFCVVLVTVFFGWRLYETAKAEMSGQFNNQQQVLAKEAATGIEEYLASLRHNITTLKQLNQISSVFYDELAQSFYKNFRNTALRDIWLVDSEGKIQTAVTGEQAVGSLISNEEFFLKAKAALPNKVYLSGIFKLKNKPDAANKWIVMSLKLHTFSPTHKPDILIFLISVDEIVKKFVLPIASGKSGYSWLLDENGILLHHPKHPEMIDRSIFESSPNCQRCHKNNFALEKFMIKTTVSGKGKFLSPDGAEKLIAYHPIYLGSRVWTIAVTAPYAEVTLLLLETFYQITCFLACLTAAIFCGTIFVLRINRQRVNLQKEQEKNLADSKKIMAVGQVALGLAHDLGNPLSIVAGSAQFCLQNLNPPDDIREHLEVIERNINASSKVIKAMLQFARPSDSQELALVSVIDIIKRTLPLLSSELNKKKIIVIKDFPEDAPQILADQGQLEQVFVNLILNSLESLPEGGQISIKVRPDRGKKFIKISVSDNGPGIMPENLENIFEPFFTTRVRGVGLGLSISKKIIEAHKGEIAARNQEAGGAMIIISLPAA